MKPKNYGYMNDVDDLIQRTPLDVVLNHYGLPLNDGSTEYRMNCVFNEGCAESQYGNLSVGTDSFKRIYTLLQSQRQPTDTDSRIGTQAATNRWQATRPGVQRRSRQASRDE